MKPRLEPVAWTWDDLVAWGQFILRFGPGNHFPLELQDMGPNADRRDADLMLKLEQSNYVEARPGRLLARAHMMEFRRQWRDAST